MSDINVHQQLIRQTFCRLLGSSLKQRGLQLRFCLTQDLVLGA